jgi:hypothetical protein
MTEGLACTCEMPLAWHPVKLDAQTLRTSISEATALLVALNQMEGMHEAEAGSQENRRLDRIEAKLDLALHLLGRALADGDRPAARLVRLSPDGASWPEPLPPAAGAGLIFEIHLSEALPLSLKLPAIALPACEGRAEIRFADLPETLADALHQFVFRRHRQAIRARGD